MRSALRILFLSAAIFCCGFMVGAVVMRQAKPACAMCAKKCQCCTCVRKTPVPYLLYTPKSKPSCGCK